jgi:hypothetical protein
MSTRDSHTVRRCLENIKQRERLITREPARILNAIALFVLLIGKLEERMQLLVRVYGRRQRIDRMTFGMIVGEIEAILKRSMSQNADIRANTDYCLQVVLTTKNVGAFIRKCKKLNEVRNNLIHRFIAPENSERLQAILNSVRDLVRLSAHPQARHEHASRSALQGTLPRDPFLAEHSNILDRRDNLCPSTIDDLIETCDLYYEGLQKSRRRQAPMDR